MKKLLLSVAIVPLTLTIVSCGGSSSPPPPPPPPPPPVADTTAPAVSFSPSTLTVASGATGASTLTATDAVGVTTGPTVSCTNGGSFASGTFTAPTVTTDTTSVCTATAADAAGNTGTGTLTVTVTAPAPDTTAPTVTFSPATLSVASGGTATSTLTATDNVGVTTGPTVTCTNGGSFSGSTFTAPTVTATTTSVCTATAGDAAGNSGTGTLTATINPAGSKVTISGTATFDFVPFQADNTGLDYNNISQRPIRGHVVEALDTAGAILVSGVTDAAGIYTLEVDPSTQVRIRVKAKMVQTTGTTWDAQVIDNTSSGALYALQGSLASSGTANSTRDLNAPSGWGGSSYTSDRSAAPFAILSPMYDTYQVFAGATTTVNFPLISFNWSPQNRPENGDRATGQIGTSSYVGNGTTGQIYILGQDGVDTDEYDDHVIVHEWGHYFEDRLSRSDSIGGQHGGSDRLDIRVAMGEGWGNAVSGIGTGDPVYKDSLNAQQGSGFAFSVEGNSYANEGWFNEGSVQSIIYDLFDNADDGSDTLSLGINPILDTFLSAAYTDTTALTSIFAFIDQVRVNATGNDAAITALLTEQTINGTGPLGAGETNNGGIAESLPVYKTLTVGGAALNFCSVDDAGTYNKLNNRQYFILEQAASGSRTITMTKTSSSPASTDPDFVIYNQGTRVTQGTEGGSGVNNSETLTKNLAAGTYVIDAYAFRNVDNDDTNQADVCFDISAN